MKTENRYLISSLKKSPLTYAKSLALLVPFFTLILTVLLSLALPLYNHSRFVKNGNYMYLYLQSGQNQSSADGGDVFLLYEQKNLTAHPDPEQDKGISRYYRYRQTVDLLLCRTDVNLADTMYTEKNVYRKAEDGGTTHIWISYELAKALHVTIGDSVYMIISVNGEETPRELAVPVTGITGTKYNDSLPTKSEGARGTGIVFFDPETFQWLTEETSVQRMPRLLFSKTALEETEHISFYTSREFQKKMIAEYIYTNWFTYLYILLVGVLMTYFLVSMDLHFTVKRHRNNMMILNMLGMPIGRVRKIMLRTALLQEGLALCLAWPLIQFVLLQALLHIYVPMLPLLVCLLCYFALLTGMTLAECCRIRKI